MSGYQYVFPKYNVMEKVTYFFSSTNYFMKQDRSSIRLDASERNELNQVLKTTSLSNHPINLM